MARRHAILEARDVQRPGLELDLVPAQRHELADAQPVTVGEEEEGAVAVAVPAGLAGRDQELLDFRRRQVLPRSAGGVGSSARGEGRARGRPRIRLLGLPSAPPQRDLPIYELWAWQRRRYISRGKGHVAV